VSHRKNACGKRPRSGLAVAAFFAPFLVAVAVFLAAPGEGLAQISTTDPLSLLQQRNGLGALGGLNNGVVDTTSQMPLNQTLQPQMLLPAHLPTSRLEQIYSARAGARLTQFGYEQLGVARSVTVPETGAVADDYIMGPGDEVWVSLRGQENNDFRTMVDRDGLVKLGRILPIQAAGRSFGSFRQDVDAAVHRTYVASTASTTIGRVRQISVLMSGEVNIPGQRIVTGLSSVVDALLLSGGIRKTGSLRNVRIQRNGHQYVVDLYTVLTGSGAGSNMRLADGDRIVVPPLGPTVAVAGLVRRPAIYELSSRTGSVTARSLLALAGGQEVRGRYRLSVQRIEPDGRLNLVSLQNDAGAVRDSEILRVELNADLATSQATLSGGTGLAGQFAVSTGTRLSDMLRAPGALGQNPYTLFGIVVRKDSRTLLRSLIAFTPVSVLGGTEDIQLQSEDVVRPITVNESQMLAYVVKTYLDKLAFDQSRIRNPLQTQREETPPPAPVPGNAASGGASAMAAVTQPSAASAVSPTNPFGLEPGQLDNFSSGSDDFSSVPADLQRANIIALLDVAAPGSPLAVQREAAYQKALAANPAAVGVAGQNPAQISQAQQAALVASRFGQAQPAVPTTQDANATMGANGVPDINAQIAAANQSASGPLAPNYQDQPAGPGSFASNQEVQTFGELSRQLGVDPLVLINFLIDHRARLDGAVRGPGPYFVGPNVSLADLVQAAGGTVSWADESGVELLTTVVDSRSGRAASQRQTLPLRQGTLASYVVRPRDQLHFNKVFTDTGIGSVSVQGEVRFAGNYPITRGEHLSDLLMRAGGLNSTAYPAGTVFLRRSAAQVEEQGYRRAADEIQSQLLAGMARIGNDKISGEGFTAIQAFISRLRNQKGLGRIAISADPSVLAANPQQDPLLEAGDVVFIPQRPSTISVLGEVMQPGSYSYQPGMTVDDYVKKAGGYAQFSDEGLTFVVLPDGSARKIETSWLGFEATRLPPGSSIVVPRDLAPLTGRQIILDVTGIMSSLAVTIASLAVLAKQ
jgi:protein involved in polysaccharide export with SLBB domain